MKLIDLLNITDYFTNIYLYKSSTELWNANDEIIIDNNATVEELTNSRYKDYEVIGITTEANALRITIYKGELNWYEKGRDF